MFAECPLSRKYVKEKYACRASTPDHELICRPPSDNRKCCQHGDDRSEPRITLNGRSNREPHDRVWSAHLRDILPWYVDVHSP